MALGVDDVRALEVGPSANRFEAENAQPPPVWRLIRMRSSLGQDCTSRSSLHVSLKISSLYGDYLVMAHEYSYRPLSSTRSTRVLLLQPNADHNAELCCVLEEISLDAAPIRRYNALSYVWGAKTGTRPLYSEGKTVLITPNCEKALRRLRHATKLVTLWVDAICINQRDLNERAKQVSLMGDVYRNAKEVVIWLGEGTKDTARCFSRMPISSQLLATRFTQVWSHLPLSLRRKADLFLCTSLSKPFQV